MKKCPQIILKTFVWSPPPQSILNKKKKKRLICSIDIDIQAPWRTPWDRMRCSLSQGEAPKSIGITSRLPIYFVSTSETAVMPRAPRVYFQSAEIFDPCVPRVGALYSTHGQDICLFCTLHRGTAY